MAAVIDKAGKRPRDERLDVFRGLTMLIIFVAHLPELPGLLHLRADPRRPLAKKVRLTLPVGLPRSDWTLRAAALPRPNLRTQSYEHRRTS